MLWLSFSTDIIHSMEESSMSSYNRLTLTNPEDNLPRQDQTCHSPKDPFGGLELVQGHQDRCCMRSSAYQAAD